MKRIDTSAFTLFSKPNFYENKSGFKIKNYGNQHYFPTKSLVDRLVELIIFTENHKKNIVPNGSVWVYNGKQEYNPSILGSDIGCGIASMIIPKLEYDSKTIEGISKVLNEMNMHIGQGNHFIDFTTKFPLDEENLTNMIFLHTDFNNKNIVPKNYDQARDMQKFSVEKRREYLDLLVKKLGINGEFYNDWTHNSVKKENGNIVYRKGAINIKDSENIGALALNPQEGIYLYISDWERHRSSMQHGSGRIGQKGIIYSQMEKHKIGNTITYVPPIKPIKELDEVYNSKEKFFDKFQFEQKQIGFCLPELVIHTKN